ncbi:hypothetical protein DNX69_22785 [Rhodopseudomonas palustris]|uniref:Type II toxin-antitoxin system PemK/MazF family toxin n=1 Tax=Rhodopseudomonas palustris TaxID=1076 RepID=A0A323UBH2_RHOPL|nr:hypothetical protein DNX69_22785 [Rhodopseudomonas palustris]
MTINFVPERGRILMCDYDMARVPPEMEKIRRVVVVSPRSYNHRHGSRPGRCVVVPFSATDPDRHATPADVPFDGATYECLTVNTWAICSAVMSVSHDRLDRVQIRRHGAPPRYSSEMLTTIDMMRIERGLKHALGA